MKETERDRESASLSLSLSLSLLWYMNRMGRGVLTVERVCQLVDLVMHIKEA